MVVYLVSFTAVGVNYETNTEIVISQLNEIVVNAAYMFFVRSIQVVSSLANQQCDLILKVWPFATGAILLITAGICIAVIAERVRDHNDQCHGYYIALVIIQSLLIVLLVTVPLVLFTVKVQRAMVIPEIKAKVRICRFAIVAMNFAIMISLLISIIRRVAVNPSETLQAGELWMRILALVTFCVLQDCLDWMAKWMLAGDESAETPDDILNEPIIP